MKTTTDHVIPNDSDDAAAPMTIAGWRSRTGHFYHGNDAERLARWDGSTHAKCSKCGRLTEKHYLLCGECRTAKDRERFYAKSEAEWDGKAMVYSESKDEYFESPSDAFESLEDGDTQEGLWLVICEPEYASISSEHFDDILPEEEHDVPDELQTAIDEFNAKMHGVAISWTPGKNRLKL